MPLSCFQMHTRPSLVRRLSWPLLLALGWMGTGGVLHHHDGPLRVGAAGLAAPSAHRPASAPPPADACAACQWMQAVTSGPLAAVRVPAPALLPRRRLALAVLAPARLPLPRRASRGPPAFLPDC